MSYDTVIIGAGPSGITCAFILAKMKQKVLLIEKEDSIGGCHRPTYIHHEGKQWFTEHGPRLYSKSFVNMFALLSSMGINGPSLFTQYKFSNVNNLWHEIHKLKMFEIWQITTAVMRSKIDHQYGRNISVLEFCQCKDFTANSIDFFDAVCRLIDGGDASRTTWYEFLQLLQGQILYKSLQPIQPNDQGLLRLMHNALVQAGVDIWHNTTVTSLAFNVRDKNIIHSFYTTDGKHVKTNKLIVSLPPETLVDWLSTVKTNNNSELFINAFGPIQHLRQWANKHRYNPDISLTLHWNHIIPNIPAIWGFPIGSEWGVAWIVMSDYMHFPEHSKTMMSVVITKPNKPCKRLNHRTCHEITDRQLILKEVVLQIQERYVELGNKFHLPLPDRVFMSPSVVRSLNNKEWTVTHKSFLDRPGYQHLHSKSLLIPNLYSLGTHNGHSTYKFTSFESAVENAMVLCHELVPETKKHFPIHKRL